MINSTVDFLSNSEYELYQVIGEIMHGEMYGVEIDSEEVRPWSCTVGPAMHDLLLYIRSGVQYIDVLTIHNGQPSLAETDLKIQGFRCRKKRKFPTV